MKTFKIVQLLALLLPLTLPNSAAQSNSLTFTTLNCYWYFQSGNKTATEAKLTYDEWDKKAGHLVGLLPAEAPLFVGFQLNPTLSCSKELSHLMEQAAGHDNFYTVLPSILWVSLIVICVFALRRHLVLLLTQLNRRISSGVPVKLGNVEFGAIRLTGHPTKDSTRSVPASEECIAERRRVYGRKVMLVHRLLRSEVEGQDYDALIYLIPHKEGTLIQVASVEYFLGSYWGDRVFVSTDRSRGFALLASAHGTFLCCAKVLFTDGASETVSRYIDFEMGEYAPFQPLHLPESAKGK